MPPEPHCAECGDERASYREQWEQWLCDHCHRESCDEEEGDRSFDVDR